LKELFASTPLFIAKEKEENINEKNDFKTFEPEKYFPKIE
jgi:hypothetical protein